MEQSGIANIKNHLSAYVERVKRGAVIVITDHNRPVAKLVPVDHGENISIEERLLALVASGEVFLPEESGFDAVVPVDLGGDVASKILAEDRV